MRLLQIDQKKKIELPTKNFPCKPRTLAITTQQLQVSIPFAATNIDTVITDGRNITEIITHFKVNVSDGISKHWEVRDSLFYIFCFLIEKRLGGENLTLVQKNLST